MKSFRKGIPVVFGLLLLCGCKVTTEPTVQDYRLDTFPSWSNDGATVAFTGNYNGVGGIYLVDTAGTNLRVLVAGVVNGGSWSPDSKWLAFAASDGIYKIKANGDSVTRLTNSIYDYHPAWSPDGSKIAFIRMTVGVMVYDIPTGEIVELFQSGSSPSWHSGGELVVVAGSGSTQGATYSFYAIRDSAVWRTLFSFGTTESCTYSSVNPTGGTEQEIAYSLTPASGYTQIWKVVLATGGRVPLTTDGGYGPAWSPDGSKIVYTRTQQGDGGLWIMNSDGSGKHRLTSPSPS